jgi:adenylate cyclase
LKEHLRVLVDPKIGEHRGRVVKNTGDGMLAEFSSVVDVVRCAVEVQRGMAERNTDVPQEKRIEFRIGINVGDMIIDGGDVFGDGVNVAARLEGIAEPGGISVSARVQEYVQSQLNIIFRDVGELQLKNIARPVRVFRVDLDRLRPTQPARLLRYTPSSRSGRWSARTLALVLMLLSAAAGAAWYFHLGSNFPISQFFGTVPSKPPEHFSIVVLPFTNLSGDASQDYLGDAISDELTTSFARISASFVIAHSTALTYKGKAIDVRQVGKELGVHYVLEGSVQPSSGRLRVNAQLIDAESKAHLWADQFDVDRTNLLQTQDDIVARLTRAINMKMAVEAARMPHTRAANPSAEILAWRCLADTIMRQNVGPVAYDASFRLCEQALQVDPENVRALSLLSHKFSRRVLGFYSSDRQADIRRAEELASAVLKINPDSAFNKGDVLLTQGRWLEAIDAYRRGLSLDPSVVGMYAGVATAHNYLGEPEQAIDYVDRAIRLSPRDPLILGFYLTKFIAYGILQDWEQALVWERRMEAIAPDHPFTGFPAAALLALAGHETEARETMQHYLGRSNILIRSIAQFKRVRLPAQIDNPRYLAWRNKFEEGLLRAGMPEE